MLSKMYLLVRLLTGHVKEIKSLSGGNQIHFFDSGSDADVRGNKRTERSASSLDIFQCFQHVHVDDNTAQFLQSLQREKGGGGVSQKLFAVVVVAVVVISQP